MTRLEESLRTALHDEAGAFGAPNRDVVAAARTSNRRRRALQGGLGSAGALSLAALLAFGLTGGMPGEAVTPTPVVQAPAGDRGEQSADTAATPNRSGYIEHLVRHYTQGGETSTMDRWRIIGGPHTGRETGKPAPRGNMIDYASAVVDGRQVTTSVVHQTRTWQRRINAPFPPMRSEDCRNQPGTEAQGTHCAYTPAALLAATRGEEPQLTVVGEERIDGRDTLRLRQPEIPRTPGLSRHLFVDADTYEIVRGETRLSGPDGYVWVEDYEFLPPTAANLELLQMEVPDGYRQKPDVVQKDGSD